MKIAGMKILMWICRHMRMNKIINENIRKKVRVIYYEKIPRDVFKMV